MDSDEALSFALKKLAEDVVRECDQRIVSTSGNRTEVTESQSNIEKPKSPYQQKVTKIRNRLDSFMAGAAESTTRCKNSSNYPTLKEPADQREKHASIVPATMEPPPNIDPTDPAFLAIKDAFSRCLNEIQSLKIKLSEAADEICLLRQELNETDSIKEKRTNHRDVGTETDSELFFNTCNLKEEKSSDDATTIAADTTDNVAQDLKQTDTVSQSSSVHFGVKENDSDSSSSSLLVQRRWRRKRQVVRRVTEQELVTSDDDDAAAADPDTDQDYIAEPGESADDQSKDAVGDQPTLPDIPDVQSSKRKLMKRKQGANKRKKNKKEFHACDLCFKSYSRPSDLKRHVLTHSKNAKNEYECAECNEIFSKFKEFQNHKKIHNESSKNETANIKCNLCDKVFTDRFELKRHKKSHPRECPVCKISISSKNYSVHVRGHTGEKPYKCTQCSQAFIGPRHLARHMRVHTGEKPYTCKVCNKSFSEAGALRTHSRRHTGERPYICETCGKAFAQLTGLTYHIRTHTGEKPYKCEVCNKRFAQVTGLENHKRTHTGEKPYCCDICGRCFAVAITFTQHKRTHTGEKPYKCDVCGRAFTTGGALHRHKVIHAGVKPHTCDLCGVSFARLGDLQRHQRIHSGIRPFKCETCGKAFSRRSHLQAHGKTHGDKKKAVVASSRPLEVVNSSQILERPVDRMLIDRPMERPMDRQIERSINDHNAINSMPPRVVTAADGGPMYLGLTNRSADDMTYNGRAIFPDRIPVDRHAMTPDSTASYHERQPIHGTERVGDPGRVPQEQDRPGSVHERPVNLQEFMPAMAHSQVNIPPGTYPQWNFNFQ